MPRNKNKPKYKKKSSPPKQTIQKEVNTLNTTPETYAYRDYLTITSFLLTIAIFYASYYYRLPWGLPPKVLNWTCNDITHWTNTLTLNIHDQSSMINVTTFNSQTYNNEDLECQCSNVTTLEYMAFLAVYKTHSNFIHNIDIKSPSMSIIHDALQMNLVGNIDTHPEYNIDQIWNVYQLPDSMKQLLPEQQQFYHAYIYAYSRESYYYLHHEFVRHGGLFPAVIAPRISLLMLSFYRFDGWVPYVVSPSFYGLTTWICGLFVCPQILWFAALFQTQFEINVYMYFCSLLYLVHCILWYLYKLFVIVLCFRNGLRYFDSLWINFEQIWHMCLYEWGVSAIAFVIFLALNYCDLPIAADIVLLIKEFLTVFGLFDYFGAFMAQQIAQEHEKIE